MMIGTITRIQMTKDCHWLTVVDENGVEHNDCRGDLYPLQLITYSETAEQIIGKQVEFRVTTKGRLEISSVEDYSAEAILAVLDARTHFLDPLAGVPRLTTLENDKLRKAHRGAGFKPRKYFIMNELPAWALPSAPYANIYYLVSDMGTYDTATSLWLGPLPMIEPLYLNTDDTVLAAASHLRRMGGIARLNAGHIVGAAPPALIETWTPPLALAGPNEVTT